MILFYKLVHRETNYQFTPIPQLRAYGSMSTSQLTIT